MMNNQYQTLFHKVKQFHTAFGHPVKESVGRLDLSDIDPATLALRAKLITEEYLELMRKGFGLEVEIRFMHQLGRGFGFDFLEASDFWSEKMNLEQIADGTGDLRYVLCGLDIVLGIDSDAVDREIHASNMSKLGHDGKPILNYCAACGSETGENCKSPQGCAPGIDSHKPIGKVLKGPNYYPPDILTAIGYEQPELPLSASRGIN